MSNHNAYSHLSPSEKEALLYILERGPTYAYYLGGDKKTRIFETEKTANTALNNLAHRGLLEKKGTKGQRERKDYYLTLKGLWIIFANSNPSDEIWSKMGIILERWGHLLPLLNKFNLFKKHGLEEEMRAFLIETSNLLLMEVEHGVLRNASDVMINLIESSMHKIDADFMLKWDKVLHEDVELRRVTKWRLEMSKRMWEDYLAEYSVRLNDVFPKLEMPSPDWNAIGEIELKLSSAHITDSGLRFIDGKVYLKSS